MRPPAMNRQRQLLRQLAHGIERKPMICHAAARACPPGLTGDARPARMRHLPEAPPIAVVVMSATRAHPFNGPEPVRAHTDERDDS